VVANPSTAPTEKILEPARRPHQPKPGHHTVKMWEKFCTPTDRAATSTHLGAGHQPRPDAAEPAQALQRKPGLADKFLIVSDVYPTATTELADLVLPSAMWVEKNGMYGNSERRTQQWFKMVKPPGEARDDCWQTIAVAQSSSSSATPA
jgi:nitrate reductase (cytochrome)